eukprot:s2098_g3.t1
MYGLQVDEWGLNRKPTGILVNSAKIAARMSRRCDHRHFHAPTMNGRPKKVQIYPKEFCRQIILGLREQIEEDNREKQTEVFAEEEANEDSEEEEGPAVVEAAGEAEGEYAVSEEEKRQVLKMHRSLGHPQKPEFVRFMRAARIKGEVIRWTSHEFRCPACEARPRPKATRPAAIPRTYQPNRVLGIDLIFLPEVGGKETFPALSILDWGSNFQMVERVENKQPETMWNALWSCWFRTFGWPDVLVCDSGKEFSKKFMQLATSSGIVVQPIAAKAPWQQGRTERHGALYKELLAKGREETVVSTREELQRLMQETEMAKNRFSNRSGYSPIQRQIGQWPKVPSTLISDDVIDPDLLDGAVVDDMERSLELRRIAQKAFIEHNARESLRRIEKGRSRVPQEFQAGDYVYVYRVPRDKKRKHEAGPRSQEHAPNKASWIGPGTVIAVDGASLWVSMFGELWRAAREQCRTATNIEKQGIEVVMRSCQELVEEYKRSSHRKGYKDIREERWPSEEEEDENLEEDLSKPERKMVRFEEPQEMEVPESEGYAPTTPLDTPPEGGSEVGETEDSEMSRRRSEETIEEPEAEARRRSSAADSEIRGVLEQTRSERLAEARQAVEESGRITGGEEGFQRLMEDSVSSSRRLEGLPAPGQPLRWRSRPSAEGPYLHEFFLISPEEETEWQEEEIEREDAQRWHALQTMGKETPKRDYWEVDLKGKRMIRHHVQKRKALFSPAGVKSTPLPLQCIEKKRTTVVNCKTEDEEKKIEDQWSTGDAKRSQGIWWTGRTEFCIETNPRDQGEILETWVTEKKGAGDIDLRNETPEAQRGWKKADALEWEKISKSGAVKVLSVEVKKRLAREGKLDRILPTRMLRKYKHAEQPNEPPTQKSRLCIRGDKDPDIFDLERFSPTVCTMNLNVVIQLAVNENMEIGIGDLKNAFCQSQPLMRKNGALYFKQPQEGIEGLHPEQIVLIIAGCYGLVDGPLHWRKSLVQSLKMLGYQESKLDPCLFKLFEDGKLCGLLAIEVDDILACGKGLHLRKIEELRTLYSFGKWVNLKESSQGASFNGRRLRVGQKGEVLIDMCKFIQERLEEIPLEKGRKSQKKEPVTESERAQARALCGSLNWLSKEGRPDAAGPSSLMSSRLTRMVVEDLIQLNEVVKVLKDSAELTIQIQPLKNMQLAVITDASFGNDGFHSQGGQMILSHEPGLKGGAKVKTNLLWWRSAKLQRVVNSTLAAETQSLSKGIGDLLWMKVLIRELTEEKFNIKEWPAKLASERVVALAKDTSSKELQECLAIVDAKSLFDHLSKESIGGQDKRTAIEIQIIRQELAQMHGEVRWIDHPAMLADPLTKVKGSTRALHDMLSTGAFGIVAEAWSVIPGLVTILICKTFNLIMGYADGVYRDRLYFAKDERLGRCSEGFTNIRTLRMLAWTPAYEQVIASARREELRMAWIRLWLQKMPAALDYGLTTLVTLVTLGFYVVTTHEQLKASLALPVIALIGSLIGPIDRPMGEPALSSRLSCGCEACLVWRRLGEELTLGHHIPAFVREAVRLLTGSFNSLIDWREENRLAVWQPVAAGEPARSEEPSTSRAEEKAVKEKKREEKRSRREAEKKDSSRRSKDRSHRREEKDRQSLRRRSPKAKNRSRKSSSSPPRPSSTQVHHSKRTAVKEELTEAETDKRPVKSLRGEVSPVRSAALKRKERSPSRGASRESRKGSRSRREPGSRVSRERSEGTVRPPGRWHLTERPAEPVHPPRGRRPPEPAGPPPGWRGRPSGVGRRRPGAGEAVEEAPEVGGDRGETEAEVGRRYLLGQEVDLDKLRPGVIGRGDLLVVSEAVYFQNKVTLALRSEKEELEGGERELFGILSGTQSEALLRFGTAQKPCRFRLHICQPGCTQLREGPDLAHARRGRKIVDEAGLTWEKNLIEEVETPALRAEEERMRRAEEDKEKEKQGASSSSSGAKRKKKKKKKKKAKGGQGDRPSPERQKFGGKTVARKTLDALYRGTGLDPDYRHRRKVCRKVKRALKRSRDASTSSSTTSATSTSDEDTDSLLQDRSKVHKIAEVGPGVLTAQSIETMKPFLNQAAGDSWAMDSKTIPPILGQYNRFFHAPRLTGGVAREATTLAFVGDLLLQARPAEAADAVLQRLKSIEMVASGAQWSTAQKLEITPLPDPTMGTRQEYQLARKEAKLDAEAKGGVIGSEKGKGKTKDKSRDKGKDKGKGKNKEGEGKKTT